jgi:hypothetical protein
MPTTKLSLQKRPSAEAEIRCATKRGRHRRRVSNQWSTSSTTMTSSMRNCGRSVSDAPRVGGSCHRRRSSHFASGATLGRLRRRTVGRFFGRG